jgi:hypothetical protein
LRENAAAGCDPDESQSEYKAKRLQFSCPPSKNAENFVTNRSKYVTKMGKGLTHALARRFQPKTVARLSGRRKAHGERGFEIRDMSLL